jgi:electron transport complex protein RnfE
MPYYLHAEGLPVWIWRELYRAAVKENPSFVLVLGNCPTLAVTVAVINGFWMAIAATGVLIGSNVIIAVLRKIIPNEIRIPCFVIVIGGFVTMTEMLLKAYVSEDINRSLGVFIPLIVVNCIIFGRAEAYAYTHTVAEGLLDGVGMGIGYMAALLLISGIREAVGAGTILGLKLWDKYEPAFIMVMAPGAFLVIGLLLGVFNAIKFRMARRAVPADLPRPLTSKEMAVAGN